MNTNLQQSVERMIEYADNCAKAALLAARLFADIEFSDKATFNLFGGTIWVHTTDRSDVEKVFAIAQPGQLWVKSAVAEELVYAISVEGVSVTLRVTAEALPPTCRLEEVEVEVPATEAHFVKRRVLKCDLPASATADVHAIAPHAVG